MSLCVISLLTSSICTAVYCCIYILISHKSDKKICEIPKRPSVKVNDCVLYKGDVIFYDGQFWSVEKICEEQLLLKNIVYNSLIIISNGWQELLLNNGFEVLKKY